MNDLISQGLKNLTQLSSLNLKFSWCYHITNEGLIDFTSQSVKDLTQLSSLNLDFSRCSKITDDGVNILVSQGLKYLTQLTSLRLDFEACEAITAFTIKNITRVLQYFGFVMIESEDICEEEEY